MGTTTIFTRHNDLGLRFEHMSKEDLKNLSKLSPFSKDNQFYLGWKAAYELHNGNIYVMAFWKGSLIKLEEAPKILNKKYYNKYNGKVTKEYEWTLLKRLILNEIEYLDKQFKKELRKKKKKFYLVSVNGKKKLTPKLLSKN